MAILQREPGSDETTNPFKPIFEEIWFYIKNILEEFSHLEKLSESATRILKHSMRIVPGLFKQNCLMDFLNIVIDKFSISPFSCYIYSVEFCLKEYAGDEAQKQIF